MGGESLRLLRRGTAIGWFTIYYYTPEHALRQCGWRHLSGHSMNQHPLKPWKPLLQVGAPGPAGQAAGGNPGALLLGLAAGIPYQGPRPTAGKQGGGGGGGGPAGYRRRRGRGLPGRAHPQRGRRAEVVAVDRRQDGALYHPRAAADAEAGRRSASTAQHGIQLQCAVSAARQTFFSQEMLPILSTTFCRKCVRNSLAAFHASGWPSMTLRVTCSPAPPMKKFNHWHILPYYHQPV